MSRNLTYFNNNRIVYRRDPITDKPDQENECYMFYINGTHECYHLFTSKAKITTFKSLKWHLLVLWYLNPQLDQDQFREQQKYQLTSLMVLHHLLYTPTYYARQYTRYRCWIQKSHQRINYVKLYLNMAVDYLRKKSYLSQAS